MQIATRPRLAVLLLVAMWTACGARAAALADDDARLRTRLAKNVLRWGGDAEGGAPFQLRNPESPSRVIGFEVELADALAASLSRRLNVPIRAEFVQYQWESLDVGLVARRDFDCIISGYEITDARREKMRFTRPYYVYSEQLVVRADDERIHDINDCRDLEVGTLAGSAAERVLQNHGITRIVGFEGQVEPYLDLELGRLDAVLLDSPIALYYASVNPRLRYAGKPFSYGEYAIALRLDDELLAAALNDALGELIRDGQWLSIMRKWHLWNADQSRLAQEPNRESELLGLGFDADSQPLRSAADPARDAVDIHIIAASATSWTFTEYAPLLFRAAGMTLFLSLTSMALAVIIALPISLARLYSPKLVQWLALVYVEFFRGIPLLLLLFVLYFGLASYGLNLPAVWTAILGFGLNYAAYEAEIYRSAILSVPQGQWEAGRALGMTDATTFRRIIFPQALQTALAPMTNDFVALFKDTSLVSVIAVRELTKEYLILSRSSLKFLELGILTAVLYLSMSVPLGYLSRYLEQRFKTVR